MNREFNVQQSQNRHCQCLSLKQRNLIVFKIANITQFSLRGKIVNLIKHGTVFFHNCIDIQCFKKYMIIFFGSDILDVCLQFFHVPLLSWILPLCDCSNPSFWKIIFYLRFLRPAWKNRGNYIFSSSLHVKKIFNPKSKFEVLAAMTLLAFIMPIIHEKNRCRFPSLSCLIIKEAIF